MKRVLVIGASGMLGHKLYQVLSHDERFSVHGTVRSPEPMLAPFRGTIHTGISLDGDLDELRKLVAEIRPHYILNAAGAIKQKDSRYAAMFHLNGAVPHLLTHADTRREVRIVHFSTDCVFTGTRGSYTEEDTPDAADAYGRSKACGELTYGDHLTIRTSIVGFELRSRVSLLSWIMTQNPETPLRGFTKAIYSGLPTVTLSELVRDLLAQELPLRGLYQVASEPIDKHALLVGFCKEMQLPRDIHPDETFHCDRSLDDSRFRRETRVPRPAWTSLLAALRRDFESFPYQYPQPV